MSGSGISWAICKSAPWPRHITTPASHHSLFYRPDALPAAQPTASKHVNGHWDYYSYKQTIMEQRVSSLVKYSRHPQCVVILPLPEIGGTSKVHEMTEWMQSCNLKFLDSPVVRAYRACDSVVVGSNTGCHAGTVEKWPWASHSYLFAYAGHSSLVVAHPATACENPVSNHAACSSGVHRDSYCDMQSWAQAAAPFLQCLGRLGLLPSMGQ